MRKYRSLRMKDIAFTLIQKRQKASGLDVFRRIVRITAATVRQGAPELRGRGGSAGCSSRYFGRLVRRESSPTLRALERICGGFHQTPNEILQIYDASREILYRLPLQVNAVRAFSDGRLAFPVCPRCGQTMEREYQSYCDRCGQSLGWNEFHHAAVLQFPAGR